MCNKVTSNLYEPYELVTSENIVKLYRSALAHSSLWLSFLTQSISYSDFLFLSFLQPFQVLSPPFQ